MAWEEIDDEVEGLEIGKDGHQVSHFGILICVSCGRPVAEDKTYHHKMAGDWTKEYCEECYRIVRKAEWSCEHGGDGEDAPAWWFDDIETLNQGENNAKSSF